jgi:hypothetical protein
MQGKGKAKKFPGTAVFVAAVMTFAAWTYFYEFKGAQRRADEKEKTLALLNGKNEDLIAIHFKDAAKSAPFNEVRAKRESSGHEWRIEAPFSDSGDKMAFEMLISGLSTQKIKEVVVDAPDISWKTFGLDQPLAEGTFTYRTSGVERTRKIVIGSQPAFDGSVYARIGEENRVVLLDSAVEALFKREARDLRDKRIFPIEKIPQFQSLVLTQNGQTEIFEKKNGKWELAASHPQAKSSRSASWPLDSTKVEELVSNIASMRGQDVWAEDKADKVILKGRKLDRPAIVAKLTSLPEPENKPQVFEINVAALDKQESLAAATGSIRPVVFSVNRSQIESISKSADDLRDLEFPFRWEASEVKALEFDRPPRREPLPGFKREGDKWAVDSKLAKRGEKDFSSREVSQDSMEKFLSELARIRALRVWLGKATVPAFGKKPDEQGFRVRMKDEAGRTSLELLFVEGGNQAVGQFLATSSKVPGRVFVVEKSFVESVPMELLKPLNAATATPTSNLIPAKKGSP